MNINFKLFRRLTAVILLPVMMICFASCRVNRATVTETKVSTTSNVVRVMFPEGTSVSQVAQMLEENGVCSASEFLAEANNPLYLEEFRFEISDPEDRAFLYEGYIFPDTYEFYRNESASTAIRRFLKNSAQKFDEDMLRRCDEIGFTLDEILTIASIIQEEAGDPSEMGKVSSVLHNRLSSRSFPKLQCDVSVMYLENYVKPYVDEERFSQLAELYNTYRCKGLPAGPISNIGSDAIRAALYPEETDYYFFITDNDGEYHYAETWAEHLDNCDAAGL